MEHQSACKKSTTHIAKEPTRVVWPPLLGASILPWEDVSFVSKTAQAAARAHLNGTLRSGVNGKLKVCGRRTMSTQALADSPFRH